jgi:hypothetical protein
MRRPPQSGEAAAQREARLARVANVLVLDVISALWEGFTNDEQRGILEYVGPDVAFDWCFRAPTGAKGEERGACPARHRALRVRPLRSRPNLRLDKEPETAPRDVHD